MTNENRQNHQSTSVKTREEIDQLLSVPSQKALFEFWNEARGQETVPMATQVDPALMVHLLKDVAIFDVLDKTNIQYRLAGTAVGERMGDDPTGKNVIEMTHPENRDAASRLLCACVNQPVGIMIEYENIYSTGKLVVVHSLYLPLGKTDKTSPRILSIHFQVKTLAYKEERTAISIATKIARIVWIDIGAGVPSAVSD